ncbi:MAG: ABC transporter ATP-binding protein [Alphaproteobacteria bacterium]
MELIQLQDIVYEFAQGNIFRLDDLTIHRGEHSLILGPSGCGKSTLLNLISGSITPHQGRIAVLGQDITALKPVQKDRFRADHMGIIFQQFNLLPFADVYTNIALATEFSKLRQKNIQDIQAEISQLLADLNLQPAAILYKKANQLSVGQQQRVAVARALLGKPQIILADEPTSALDDHAANRFMELIFKNAEAVGATVIMVSHNRDFIPFFPRNIALAEIAKVGA